MTEKERYASINTWIKVFADEGISVSGPLIRNKLKEAEIVGEDGRESVGRLLRKGFYAESDVRRLLGEHLTAVGVDQNGFMLVRGKRYSTIRTWAEVFEVAWMTIAKRMKGMSDSVIRGKGLDGKVCDLYAEQDIRAALSDLIDGSPVADDDGFIERNGEKYATIGIWADHLGIYDQVIRNKLRRAELPAIQGKDRGGHLAKFYREADIRQLLEDELAGLPRTDENGFCVIDGERYGIRLAWRREFDLGVHIIANRMKGKDVPYVKGKDQGGKVLKMYAESVIRELCSDQFEEYPEVDDDGFIIKNGERYATVNKWAEILDVSEPTIFSRCREDNLSAISGKTQNGHVHDFFAESDVRASLRVYLQNLHKAGEDGFFVIDGERYTYSSKWAEVMDLSIRKVSKTLKRSPLPSVHGRVCGGQLRTFYAESDMRRLFADLIYKRRKK